MKLNKNTRINAITFCDTKSTVITFSSNLNTTLNSYISLAKNNTVRGVKPPNTLNEIYKMNFTIESITKSQGYNMTHYHYKDNRFTCSIITLEQ